MKIYDIMLIVFGMFLDRAYRWLIESRRVVSISASLSLCVDGTKSIVVTCRNLGCQLPPYKIILKHKKKGTFQFLEHQTESDRQKNQEDVFSFKYDSHHMDHMNGVLDYLIKDNNGTAFTDEEFSNWGAILELSNSKDILIKCDKFGYALASAVRNLISSNGTEFLKWPHSKDLKFTNSYRLIFLDILWNIVSRVVGDKLYLQWRYGVTLPKSIHE